MLKRFKERDPKQTIDVCKSILSNLGLTVNEYFTHNTKNIWSGYIHIPEIGYATNGKGSTEDFCRASAYGEMMERIQNLGGVMKWNELTEESQQFGNYRYFKDEKQIPIDSSIYEKYPYIMKDLESTYLSADNEEASKEEILDYLINYFKRDFCLAVPFYNVTTKEVEEVPYDLIGLLNGTNGMCAGNSTEEALVQGIAEILERYTEFEIYRNNLTPPEVSKEYIKTKNLFLYELIQEVEELSQCNLFVYDCSLGLGYPVIAIALMDRNDFRYRIQFGAHPLFDIALERCLTEVLQGYYNYDNYQKDRSLVDFSMEDRSLEFCNLEKRFRIGVGYSNSNWFNHTSSWEFEPWYFENKEYSNEIGLKHLTETIISNTSKNILIRDNSVLGFPAYTIYIPGMSNNPSPIGFKVMKDNLNLRMIEELPSFKEYCKTDLSTWKDLCQIMISYIENTNRRLAYYDTAIFMKIPNNDIFLKAILYKEIGDLKASNMFIEELALTNKYCRAIYIDNKMLIAGKEEADRNNIIVKYLDYDALEFLKTYWRSPNYIDEIYNNMQHRTDVFIINNKLKSLKINSILYKFKEVQEECGSVDQNYLKKIWIS